MSTPNPKGPAAVRQSKSVPKPLSAVVLEPSLYWYYNWTDWMKPLGLRHQTPPAWAARFPVPDPALVCPDKVWSLKRSSHCGVATYAFVDE